MIFIYYITESYDSFMKYSKTKTTLYWDWWHNAKSEDAKNCLNDLLAERWMNTRANGILKNNVQSYT